MPSFRVPPGCTGIEMQDGRRYDANRSGLVQVDDRHASFMKTAHGGAGHIHEVGFRAPQHTGGIECGCGFRAFAWQSTCPRCGANLKEISA